MASKPTTVKPTAEATNSAALEWPQDTYGFTSMLRKEGARAAGRIKGDPEKLNTYLQTLQVLGEHAQAKMAAQVEQNAADIAAAKARFEQDRSQERAAARRRVQSLKQALGAAEADLVAAEAV